MLMLQVPNYIANNNNYFTFINIKMKKRVVAQHTVAVEVDKDDPSGSVCTHVNHLSITVPTQILRIHKWTLYNLFSSASITLIQ